MYASVVDSVRSVQADVPLQAAWRWRYRDPVSGEVVSHSELLTTEQVSAIDPRAEVIPGSRVLGPIGRSSPRAWR